MHCLYFFFTKYAIDVLCEVGGENCEWHFFQSVTKINFKLSKKNGHKLK